jgi:hypothetical protein
LQRCSVTGITSNSIVVRNTRRRLNGRAHWLQSRVHPRHPMLQMAPKCALISSQPARRRARTMLKRDTLAMRCRAHRHWKMLVNANDPSDRKSKS